MSAKIQQRREVPAFIKFISVFRQQVRSIVVFPRTCACALQQTEIKIHVIVPVLSFTFIEKKIINIAGTGNSHRKLITTCSQFFSDPCVAFKFMFPPLSHFHGVVSEISFFTLRFITL